MENKTLTDGKHFVYLATAISALGGMLFGYDIGVISGAILFIKKAFSLSAGMEEIVVSSVLLGSLAGAAAGGVLADRLGRRRLLIITAIVFGLGAVGAALAQDTAWLIIARIIAGVAIGIASFVAPLYISEIAPVAIRGKLVSINQVALTCGIVVSYLIDYAFAGSQAWRWMFAMAVIPAAAFGIGLIFIPDSPRWLAACGHEDLVVALSFLTLTQVMGKAAAFWLYGAVSIGAWLFAFFLAPETKGKTLEQIEEHWRAGKHPRAL